MAMARGSSGLAYPDRFFAAASYAGFDGSTITTTTSSKFANDAALLLYALYQQATAGPCDAPKPRGWSPVEQSKWTRKQQQKMLGGLFFDDADNQLCVEASWKQATIKGWILEDCNPNTNTHLSIYDHQ